MQQHRHELMLRMGHIKAHRAQSVIGELPAEERRQAVGNDLADSMAKEANRTMHPQPHRDSELELESSMLRTEVAVRVFAKVLVLFPREHRAGRVRTRGAQAVRAAPPHRDWCKDGNADGTSIDVAAHHWVQQAGNQGKYCCKCLDIWIVWTAQAPAAHWDRRFGPTPSVQAALNAARGHRVVVAGLDVTLQAGEARSRPARALVYCVRCGAFATKRASNLLKPCKGGGSSWQGSWGHSAAEDPRRPPPFLQQSESGQSTQRYWWNAGLGSQQAAWREGSGH